MKLYWNIMEAVDWVYHITWACC